MEEDTASDRSVYGRKQSYAAYTMIVVERLCVAPPTTGLALFSEVAISE